ncbi:MAG: inorganic phosphate transporter [Elusimicrobia bacterium]|nr:inorganic phosphate transporter [Elusimicrobiota bacterium]
MLTLTFAAALIYVFWNGLHDSPTILAQIFSTRSMGPRRALLMTGALEFVGAVFFSGTVLKTMSFENTEIMNIVRPASQEIQVFVLSALMVALVFNVATWYLGFPSSSTHALFGAITGAALALGMGRAHIVMELAGLFGVLLGSAVIGSVLGFLLTRGVYRLDIPYHWGEFWVPRLNTVMAGILPLLHGANDVSKGLGLFLMARAAAPASFWSGFSVQGYIVLFALMISAGMLFGENKILKTLGRGIFCVRPIQGLTSGVVSASTMAGCTALGFPISSTQVLVGALLGAGAAKNVRQIRWMVVGEILLSWIVTLPACLFFGYLAAKFLGS